MFFRNDIFKNDFVLYNIGEKEVPLSPLSIGENRRSLAACILELFKKQWSVLCFETNNRSKVYKECQEKKEA